jgi:hypothetical protein
MQRFQNGGLGGAVQHHGHHVHRTLSFWTIFWEYDRDKVYSTPVPDIDTLKARIRDALTAVTEEKLEKTWREIECRLDVLRATSESYVQVYQCSTKSFLR